jgi:hypothetical protein
MSVSARMKLTKPEADILESLFRGIGDGELIRELVRRGRLGQVQTHIVIEDELRDSPNYMTYVKERLGVLVGRELAKETEPGYVVTEQPHPANPHYCRVRTVRTADVVFLRPRAP